MGATYVGESFVARVWLESRSNGDPVWRGHIRHIQSGEERHFGNIEEMREFAEQLTGVPWRRAPPGMGGATTPTRSGRSSKGK